MSQTAFTKIMRGLKEAKAFTNGELDNYKVTVPPSIVKSIHKSLKTSA